MPISAKYVKINRMLNIEVKQPERCFGQKSLFVSFDYDPTIVETIKQFPVRYYNPKNHKWELPYESMDELKRKITSTKIAIYEEKEAVRQMPANLNLKTTLMPHQQEVLKYSLAHDTFVLGDEMGTGKTLSIISTAILNKQYGVKRCLVICGVNTIKWNWYDEVNRHSNESCHILGMRKLKTKDEYRIGTNQDKIDDLNNLDKIDSYFIVTNIESLRDDKLSAVLKRKCKTDFGMVVVDEIHKCSNTGSKQGRRLVSLPAQFKIAASGTPLMNNPKDLFLILKWLGYEHGDAGSFKWRYYKFIDSPWGYKEHVGYKNLDELQIRLNNIMLRRLKEDVVDLPEKVYIDERLEMSKAQEDLYKEYEEMDIPILTKLTKQRQVTADPSILGSNVDSVKMERMKELVDEAVQNGRQVLVFSNWTSVTDSVVEKLNEYSPVQITGEISTEQRKAAEVKFQSGEAKVLVATIGAAGVGLTLTNATVEIFMDEPWNRASKEQAVDRGHRIGQKNKLTIYTLMCKDTRDEWIHALVEGKGELADEIVDGEPNEEKLKYLLSKTSSKATKPKSSDVEKKKEPQEEDWIDW